MALLINYNSGGTAMEGAFLMGPAGAGFEYFLRPILGAHGLTYDDLTPLYATQTGDRRRRFE